MSDRISVIDRLRNPEYTGENRCIPCTAVNVTIAIVVGGAVAAAATIEAGLAVVVISILVIYLRGYLVPYTPTLTERYLPDRVLAYFDSHPTAERNAPEFEPASAASDGGAPDSGDAGAESTTHSSEDGSEEYQFETVKRIEKERENRVDPDRFLQEEGIVVPCEEIDDLCFSETVHEAIDDRLDYYRGTVVSRKDIASLLDVGPEAIELRDRAYPTIKIRRRLRKWPSKAALLADLATNDAIDAHTDRWETVPFEQRLEILKALRSFHESCPLCFGGVEFGAETVESCCRSYEVYAIACVRCEEPLVEFGPDELDPGASDTGITP